ncbi:hypothetical protein [Rhodobacter sp. 24-YEA-8]|uniref:hypothetical protein n=1 Tax=Rhodobacter sp. 24-YEA-8 TaxID=1884310 RepID=UPI000B824585
MRRKADGHAAATGATFCLTIRAGLILHRIWETRRQPDTTIFRVTNGCFTPRRQPSALTGKSPLAFRRQGAQFSDRPEHLRDSSGTAGIESVA